MLYEQFNGKEINIDIRKDLSTKQEPQGTQYQQNKTRKNYLFISIVLRI
jgi:hypothetical protein